MFIKLIHDINFYKPFLVQTLYLTRDFQKATFSYLEVQLRSLDLYLVF